LALSLPKKLDNYSRMIQSSQSGNCDWKPLYKAALLETDVTKLPQRITAARSAILNRIEESFTHSLLGEHRAMDDALRNLRRLAKLTTIRAA
jgi:inhibitor of KinA sporulation pathway (predicted exonuclease)